MTYFSRLGRDLQEQRPFRWLLAVCIGAFVGIAAGYNLKGSVSIVDGSSMAPTYQPGAYVFTTPISSPLQRGDVVLVDDAQEDYALKRIVGMPGETIHIWRGYIFVDRKLLVERYLPKYTLTFPDQRRTQNRFQLRQDEYFVLGDNRLTSVDSRAYGPIGRGQIKARVPSEENTIRPEFRAYTLPSEGKSLIQQM